VIAVRRLDLASLGRALLEAPPWALVLVAALSFTMLVAKAGYWHNFLSPVASVPLRTMLGYTIAAGGASLALPLRGGEALRVFWLRQKHGASLPAIGTAVAFEKLFDVTALVLLVAPLPWILPSVGRGRLWMGVPAAIVAIVVAVVLVRRASKRVAWLQDVRLADRFGPLIRAFGCVLGSWLADVAMILLVLYAVGIPVQLSTALFVLLAVNLAIAIPAAPGNLGSHELGAALALTTIHVTHERAFAFAILYHGVQIVTLLVAWTVQTLVGQMVAASPHETPRLSEAIEGAASHRGALGDGVK
jgi:uncharacterized membrane protein YbhN (UPF0104 family)